MPTYDYICESCGCRFEQFQSITARPLRKCSKCGKNKLKRLIGAGAGVIFKGSGFYETDYRNEGYKKAKEGEKKKADKDTGKKETKEAKPKESKPEKKGKSEKKDKKKTA
jgi:putative FmdB family regulatory protein